MSIKEILQNAGFKIVLETADYYRMKPLHRASSNPSCLAVNKKTGQWKDWGSTDHGSLEYLIKITTGGKIDFQPIINDVDDLKEEISISFNKEEIKALLPSYSFYNKKGISNETLKLFQGGFCQGGKMYNRFVFPIYNRSGMELVGLAGRAILENPVKWKLMGKKTKWSYPLFVSESQIIQKKSVILVESIGDLLSLYESGIKNVLVLFGTAISNHMISEIITLCVSRIIIATNNDSQKNINAGQIAAQKIKEKLSCWFSTSSVDICLPEQNDFGDMSKEEILKWKIKYNVSA